MMAQLTGIVSASGRTKLNKNGVDEPKLGHVTEDFIASIIVSYISVDGGLASA